MSSPTRLELDGLHPCGSPGLDTAFERERMAARMFGLAEPVKVGRFVIERKLGEGGMGTVYLAHDGLLHRRVAIKVLKLTESSDDPRASLLLREAAAMARINHPNVAAVYEAGFGEVGFYLAMEYVEGLDLRRWAESLEAPPSIERLREIALQLGEGLRALHAAGIVHRDLKPANVLLGADERIRIVDFGLSHLVDLARARSVSGGHESGDDLRTSPGRQIVGTPAYMAPEQLDGEADERSDIFSLCVTLYELAYGARPFPANSVAELRGCYALGTRPRRERRNRRLPRWFRRTLERGLAIDPRDRFPDAASLVGSLRSSSGHRRWWASVAAVGASAGVLMAATPELAATRCELGPLDEWWRAEGRASFESRQERDPGWAPAMRRLDDWVAAWELARARACGEDDADEGLVCLAAERETFERVVDFASESPESEQLRWILTSREVLPEVGRCDDLDRERADVDALRELVGALSTARRAIARADWDAAESHSSAAWERANERGWWTLASVAALLRASAALDMESYDDAKLWADRLLEVAERTGVIDAQISGWKMLAAVSRKRQEFEAAEFALTRARSLARADGVALLTRARLAYEAGLVAHGRSRFDEALDAFVEAEQGFRAAAGPDSVLRAEALLMLATPRMATGDLQGAIDALRESVRILEKHPGSNGLLQAKSSAMLAQLLELGGQRDEALAHAERGWALTRASGFPSAAALQVVLVYAQQSRRYRGPDAAYSILLQALTEFDAERPGDWGTERCTAESGLGVIAADLGRADLAIEHMQRALACPGLDPRNQLIQHTNVAVELAKVGDMIAARSHVAQAQTLATTFARERELVAGLEVYWGEVAERSGDLVEAELLYARVLEQAERDDIDVAEVAQARFGWARLVFDRQPQAARRAAEQALATLDDLPAAEVQRREVAAWLAAHPEG